MSMFGAPSESNIENQFSLGDELILWDITAGESFTTSLGEARESVMQVSKIDSPDERFTITSLGRGFARLADRKNPEELPAVVKFEEVKGQRGRAAKVLTFVRKLDDIPF